MFLQKTYKHFDCTKLFALRKFENTQWGYQKFWAKCFVDVYNHNIRGYFFNFGGAGNVYSCIVFFNKKVKTNGYGSKGSASSFH